MSSGLRWTEEQWREHLAKRAEPRSLEPTRDVASPRTGRGVDIAGQKFGRLTAIEPTVERSDKKVVWRFQCDCGRETKTTAVSVRSGNTTSCGCAHAVASAARAAQVEISCARCGVSFKRKRSHVKFARYCGESCMAAAYKETQAGPANPNWKGGVNGDPEYVAARAKRYKTPEKVQAANRNTKARRKAALGKHSQADIDAMWERQRGKCAACGASFDDEPHVDHIVPIARGGTNFVGNLQLLCAPCNLAKHAKLPIEFRVRVLGGTTEDAEQEKVIRWARDAETAHPELELLYHVGNGGHRNKKTAAKMQRLGVKAGVPDLALPVPKGPYAALFIEMKVGRNQPTPKQREWIDRLNRHGNRAVVCWGAESARVEILNYLSLGVT